MENRRKTRRIRVGGVPVGGGAPVSVQSMTNTDTRDVRATVAQIRSLAREGCEIVRVAVPDAKAAAAFGKIRAGSPIPVIADIHFDHRLAIACADAGADGLRINPGNIGGEKNTIEVLRAARANRIPVRIGVNAGSVEKDLLAKHGGPTPKALVASAARYLKICEKARFTALKFSLKASDVVTDDRGVPPLLPPVRLSAAHRGHRGGDDLLRDGQVVRRDRRPARGGDRRHAAGIAHRPSRGRGPRRLADPEKPRAAAAGAGVHLLPDLRPGVDRRRRHRDRGGAAPVRTCRVPLKVAVMGCAVNGPGEAREADVGVAGGKGEGLIFVKGKIVEKVKENEIVAEVVRIARRLAAEKRRGK